PNDYYEVLPTTGRPFSISFWLRPRVLSIGRNALMSCGEGTNDGWRLALEMESSGQTWLDFESVDTGGTLALRAPLTLTNGSWTRLELTYNGGLATAYVNARKVRAESGAIRGSRAPP